MNGNQDDWDTFDNENIESIGEPFETGNFAQ